MMISAANIDMMHIPYKGGGPATNDVLAGHVDLMFGSSVVMPYVRDNRLRLLAVTTGLRSPLIPDVPTVAEQGLPGYDVDTWYGVLAPAGTPKPIVDLLAREIDKAVQDPKVAGSLRAMLLVPGGSDPAQFDAQIAREIAKWRIVAKKANITLDGPK
jgi:tripartite-type tricarboxylate transporter receptor subunit TctC